MGELRALRWRDVDWGNGVIHVRLNSPVSAPAEEPEKAPKSGKTRSVPITDVAARELDALSRRAHFVGLDDYVFPSATGAIVDGKDLRDAFYDALEATGLGRLRKQETPIVFHDLRHTFAFAVESGAGELVEALAQPLACVWTQRATATRSNRLERPMWIEGNGSMRRRLNS